MISIFEGGDMLPALPSIDVHCGDFQDQIMEFIERSSSGGA